MTAHDVVVVGGGLSGLSFAFQSARSGRSTLVLEKSPRLGGCIHSHRLPDGFWFELGAHTCYNSYGGLIDILEACRLGAELVPRAKVPFRLLRDGKLRPIGRELSYWEIVRSLPRALTTRKDGQSVASYYSRLVGKKNYERVLGPFLAAVPSQRADDFPAGMLFKKRRRRKDIRRSFTLRQGLGQLVDAIGSRLRPAAETAVAVVAIEREGDGYSIVPSEGPSVRARAVVLAVPPDAAARLAQPCLPELSRALGRIRMATVETLGVVVAKAKLTLEPVAGIVPQSDSFFSAVSRDTVPDERYRAFAFHFAPGVPRDTKLERVAEVLHVRAQDFVTTAETSARLPSPVLGHERIVQEVDRLIAGTTLFVTGNYFAGLALEDCVGRSLSEFARFTQAP